MTCDTYSRCSLGTTWGPDNQAGGGLMPFGEACPQHSPFCPEASPVLADGSSNNFDAILGCKGMEDRGPKALSHVDLPEEF